MLWFPLELIVDWDLNYNEQTGLFLHDKSFTDYQMETDLSGC